MDRKTYPIDQSGLCQGRIACTQAGGASLPTNFDSPPVAIKPTSLSEIYERNEVIICTLNQV